MNPSFNGFLAVGSGFAAHVAGQSLCSAALLLTGLWPRDPHTPVPAPLLAVSVLTALVSMVFAGYVAARVGHARGSPEPVVVKWCGWLLLAFYGAASIFALTDGQVPDSLVPLVIGAIPATRWGARIARRSGAGWDGDLTHG